MSAGMAESGTTHCTSPVFCTKQKDLGSNLSPSPDSSTFDLCLTGKKEGKLSHLSSNDDPHRLRCGSCTITARKGLFEAGHVPFPYSYSRRDSPESGSSTRACICHKLGLQHTPDTHRSPGEREEEKGAGEDLQHSGWTWCLLLLRGQWLFSALCLRKDSSQREKKGIKRKNDPSCWQVRLVLTGASEGSAVINPAGLQEPTRKERHKEGLIKRQLTPRLFLEVVIPS